MKLNLNSKYIEEQEEQEDKKARKQESKSRSERVDVGSGYYCSASGIYNNGRVRWGRKEDRTLTSELDPDR